MALQLVWTLGLQTPDSLLPMPHNPSLEVRMCDDAFAKICDLVNDLAMPVRARAAQLLGDFHSVSPHLLDQTLDKKLMAHLKVSLSSCVFRGNDEGGGGKRREGGGGKRKEGGGGKRGEGEGGKRGEGEEGRERRGEEGREGREKEGREGRGEEGRERRGEEGREGRGKEGREGRGEEGRERRGKEGREGRGKEGREGRGEEGRERRGKEGREGRGSKRECSALACGYVCLCTPNQ